MKKIAWYIFFCVSVPLFASYKGYDVPDSGDIRGKLVERWFEAPLSILRKNEKEVYKNSIGVRFQVSMEEEEGGYYIFVTPESEIRMDVYKNDMKTVKKEAIYIPYSKGSFALKKSKETNEPLFIRYYFTDDNNIYVEIHGERGNAYADFVIQGFYAARGASLGVPFEKLYSTSFQDFVKLSSGVLPWKFADVKTGDYSNIKSMIKAIDRKLPYIRAVDNSMYDEKDVCIFVTTGKKRETENDGKLELSDEGFLKWISDGILAPLTGARLKREPLLRKTVRYKDTGLKGVVSQKYDISFSLDWIRNLSAAISSVLTEHEHLYENSGVDVEVEPFAAMKGGHVETAFLKDTGYKVPVLKALLYVLAVSEPNTFYFGAIRESDKKAPEISAFNKSVVIFPYFDEKKKFKCVVYRGGKKMSINDFCAIYFDDFVFLTRNRASEYFHP